MSAALFDFLHRHTIAYTRVDHPAVFTADEAGQHVPPMPGAEAKNLFVRDARAERFLLVVVPFAKRVDLNALAGAVGLRKLSFASSEQLMDVLGVTPGSVSLMALVNDAAARVTVVIDEAVWNADGLQCHPLINTATLSIAAADLRRFIAATGHEPRILDVPGRVAA